MSNEFSKFRPQSNSEGIQQSKTGPAKMEFQSAEELLRHDAAAVAVPPSIAERLKSSLARETGGRRSWWGRFFKSGS